MNQNNLTIKVKYHTDIDPLQQIKIGDAIDVRAAKDVDLKVFESTHIPLGFSCELPKGYFELLFPTYCGDGDEWAMPVAALKTDVHISKNDRIGQFIILPKMPTIDFQPVDTLGNEDRNGFGSTGRA